MKSERSREVALGTPEDSNSGLGGGQIRTMIQDRPDCLEDGLSIYTDSKAEPVGLDYRTDVGPIDLLARDDAGGLVVVMVAPDSKQSSEVHGKELVSEALERVGWVRKHVAEPKQEVRAIVLLEHIPDDISYTAAAVASTVAFKTYRLEINFSDVEL
ncbi:MAG: RecB family endonuclease NucS [Myxococcota bacterium]|jgi:RecB family endonuclease NucS